MIIGVFDALGAVPRPIKGLELFNALKTGLVAGQGNISIDYINSRVGIWMSPQKWASMSAKQFGWRTAAADKAGADGRALHAAELAQAEEDMKAMGTPIALARATTVGLYAVEFAPALPEILLIQTLMQGLDNTAFNAILHFFLAGAIMNLGGMSARLLRVALIVCVATLTLWLPGYRVRAMSDAPEEQVDTRIANTLTCRILVAAKRIVQPFPQRMDQQFGLTLPEWRFIMTLAAQRAINGEDIAREMSMDKTG